MIKFKDINGEDVWIRPRFIISVSEFDSCVQIAVVGNCWKIGEHIDSVLNKIKNHDQADGGFGTVAA